MLSVYGPPSWSLLSNNAVYWLLEGIVAGTTICCLLLSLFVSLQFSWPAGCRAAATPIPRCSTPALLVAASLPSDAELFILMRSCLAIAASAAQQEEAGPLLAHKLIKATLESAAASHARPAHSPIRGVEPVCEAFQSFCCCLLSLS